MSLSQQICGAGPDQVPIFQSDADVNGILCLISWNAARQLHAKGVVDIRHAKYTHPALDSGTSLENLIFQSNVRDRDVSLDQAGVDLQNCSN